jgi:hypothetical protein
MPLRQAAVRSRIDFWGSGHTRFMRKVFAVVAVAAIAAAVAVSVAAAMGSFSAGSKTRPQQPAIASAKAALTLVSLDPMKVKGVHFKKRERVRVTLSGAGTRVRHVRAGLRGSFGVGFGRVGCASYTVTAVGNRGSRASINYSTTVCP